MQSLDFDLIKGEHFTGFKKADGNLYIHTNLDRVFEIISYKETFDAVEVMP